MRSQLPTFLSESRELKRGRLDTFKWVVCPFCHGTALDGVSCMGGPVFQGCGGRMLDIQTLSHNEYPRIKVPTILY